MSLLDMFLDTKITDDKNKIHYKGFDGRTAKSAGSTMLKCGNTVIKSTKNAIANGYYFATDWCNMFKHSDIYNKCVEHICEQLGGFINSTISDIPSLVAESFTLDYWYDDCIQKKYSIPQLKRIEKEFDAGKNSEILCNEMLQYVWGEMAHGYADEDAITETVAFKIRNKARRMLNE